nr:immunoglobulin heavy chain junction region [Macaca mulatta]MOX62011.1 immunoglobulin heavy chain junction region [Macaca mulatta]MOX63162.1 immunoglobulin heavy chain junction region [Macaca mulatta]MOX63239.1 immunoglobulin heavy chain junction region [Macaca mulatta]MOX63824.1 immunoglobulin heavy chain junction region [Macaca mulatta]
CARDVYGTGLDYW